MDAVHSKANALSQIVRRSLFNEAATYGGPHRRSTHAPPSGLMVLTRTPHTHIKNLHTRPSNSTLHRLRAREALDFAGPLLMRSLMSPRRPYLWRALFVWLQGDARQAEAREAPRPPRSLPR